MLILEHKLISEAIGIIKAELVEDGKVIVKGSMARLLEPLEENSKFDMLKKGESYFEVYSLDYKGQDMFSSIKEGFNKSLREGKIPFLRK